MQHLIFVVCIQERTRFTQVQSSFYTGTSCIVNSFFVRFQSNLFTHEKALVQFSIVQYSIVQFSLVQFSIVQFGLVWYGLVWYGIVYFILVYWSRQTLLQNCFLSLTLIFGILLLSSRPNKISEKQYQFLKNQQWRDWPAGNTIIKLIVTSNPIVLIIHRSPLPR